MNSKKTRANTLLLLNIFLDPKALSKTLGWKIREEGSIDGDAPFFWKRFLREVVRRESQAHSVHPVASLHVPRV